MASTQSYLDLISQYESGNRNIPNYRYDPTHTAQGYYQITNDNWNKVAPVLGIDTSVYPNAMAAPQDVQAQVATYLLTQTPAGISNWANYNPQLASALTGAGLQTSGQIDTGTTVSGALIDLSGNAAATPTASIMDQISTQLASAGVDVSSPGTALLIAGGIAAAILVFTRS